jgi:hypothetical protein
MKLRERKKTHVAKQTHIPSLIPTPNIPCMKETQEPTRMVVVDIITWGLLEHIKKT